MDETAGERNTFSWFPALTDIVRDVAGDFPEHVGEFALAVALYGTDGVEPDFSGGDDRGAAIALKYAFASARTHIDNSISARANARRGGRRRRDERCGDTRVPEAPGAPRGGETPVAYAETGVSETETSVSDARTGVPRGARDGETAHTVGKDRLGKEMTCKEREGEVGGGPRARACVATAPPPCRDAAAPDEGGFDPPDPAEVRAYFQANLLRGDPEEFYDHYAAQGWVRGNGMPVAEWRPLAKKWSRDQVEFDQRKPPEARAPVAPLPRAENRRDYEAELAAIDAELEARGGGAL